MTLTEMDTEVPSAKNENVFACSNYFGKDWF